MTASTWIVALLALAVGGAVGFGWARRAAAGAAARLAVLEKDLAAQQARAADAVRAAQARAAKELQDARTAWEAQAAAAGAAQRGEIEKLTRHLTDAYDELDRLRTAAARAPGAPDTGHGFPATMPLGDL